MTKGDIMLGLGKYDEFDKDSFVSADDLARAIEDLVERSKDHIQYIESALQRQNTMHLSSAARQFRCTY